MLDLQPIAGEFSVATFTATALPCENGHAISHTKTPKKVSTRSFQADQRKSSKCRNIKSPSSSKIVFPLAPRQRKVSAGPERCSASPISLVRRQSPHPRPHSARCDHPSHFSYGELAMRCKRDLFHLLQPFPALRHVPGGGRWLFLSCQSF